ncbi:sarcosine oxidase subunit gamma family protein [Micromonospora sp. NPDC049679]|uniref:sarcosine oxidase subunit gamma n=1 Tax=Micromonospora sp. NPDC049679 TaxID=3155920 RepID=UPI0033DE32DE
MAEHVTRRSPLGHSGDRLAEVAHATGGAVSLSEVPFLAQINLRLDSKGPAADAVAAELGMPLPTGAEASASSGPLTALWLGPDEWLVLGPAGTEGALESRLRSAVGDEHASVVDVSAQRTTLRVAGPRTRDLLALGCALDLHPRSFGTGNCAQTTLAKAQVVLVGREPDDGEGSAFWILVRASFATYLVEWLIDASVEFSTAG